MISPFEVYLVMQLDQFLSVCYPVAIFGTFLGISISVPGWVENFRPAKIGGGLLLLTGLLATVLVAFLPSTKTAAAMLILPAITSGEVVKPLGNEAKELYDLAKDALRKAVDAPAPKSSNEAEKSDVE